MSNTDLAIPTEFQQLAAQLNQSVLSVIDAETINGFEKAYTVATAVEKLSASLTEKYMKPIMALQGNRLGFKTDKDKDGGYPMPIVKNCLIEAVLMGLQPYGNEFNIIAGNTYATKEGLGALLKKTKGLTYEIIQGVPVINGQIASIKMKVRWTLHGSEAQERELEFSMKANAYTTSDAIVGKGIRKTRKWLHDTIHGFEIPVDDSDDNEVKPKSAEINHEDLELLYDMKKDAMKDNERKAAEKILNEKSVKDYARLHKHLMSL